MEMNLNLETAEGQLQAVRGVMCGLLHELYLTQSFVKDPEVQKAYRRAQAAYLATLTDEEIKKIADAASNAAREYGEAVGEIGRSNLLATLMRVDTGLLGVVGWSSEATETLYAGCDTQKLDEVIKQRSERGLARATPAGEVVA